MFRDYRGDVDWILVGSVAFVSLIFLTLVTLLILWVLHIRSWAMHPPKVITKVVTVNQFTAAQNTYVQDCENNRVDIDGNMEGGIPDVHTNKWTCIWPHN